MRVEIRIKGHLSTAWVDWFDPLAITNNPNGEAILSGQLPDQSALVGVLNRLHGLNLTILAVASLDDDGVENMGADTQAR